MIGRFPVPKISEIRFFFFKMASEDPRDGLGVLSLIDSLDVQTLEKPEEPRGVVEGV